MDSKKARGAIVAYVKTHGQITNRECRHLLGIRYDDAIALLGRLCQDRLLTRVGVASGTKYILTSRRLARGKSF